MHPHTRASISWLFCRIIVSSIVRGRDEVGRELVGSRLYLLEKEYIRIVLLYEILDFSFFLDCTDTVHIPGDDTHKNIINKVSLLYDFSQYFVVFLFDIYFRK
jgi:hypothetical protein